VPLEDAEAALEARKPGSVPAFEIWRANLEALEIFCALQTQWRRISGLGGTALTGIIYSEAIGYMRELGLRRVRRAELLGDLRVMERAALETWNKPSDG
jgi:hypothetical protein